MAPTAAMLDTTMQLVRRTDGNFVLYHYVPSMAAAVIFIVLFALSTTLHSYQMSRTRTWFMIPFCIGGILEVIGYIGRTLASSEAPNYTLGTYIMQTLCLLVAPALFAASIYMELARIVLMVDGDHYLFIRRTWLTKLFVTGDVLSFLMQSGGGGLMASGNSSTINTGKTIVMIALILQVLYFGLFVLAGVMFHIKMNKMPTEKGNRTPWKKHMWSLYIVSILIFVRCLVRVIEYGQGFNGYIISHEVFLYVFDAVPMFFAMATMNFVHPSEVKANIKGGKAVRKAIFIEDITTNEKQILTARVPNAGTTWSPTSSVGTEVV